MSYICQHMVGSIYLDVIDLFRNENSKESKKVLDALNNKKVIKDIITDGYVFWLEEEDNCPNYIRCYLKQLIKRRMLLMERPRLSYWESKRICENLERLAVNK